MANEEMVGMIDDSMEMPVTPVTKKEPKAKKVAKAVEEVNEVVSCLRNERIIVRHVPRASGMVSNPKHVLYGGMAEGSKKTFTVPRLTSGTFVNVLTKAEKAFLEDIMGLEYDALSVYKKVNNFWDDSNSEGICHSWPKLTRNLVSYM